MQWLTRNGKTDPLGASVNAEGVNFCVFAEHAESVSLSLYDHSGHSEVARVPLHRGEAGLWSVQIDGLHAGQLYGYRVHGPFAPQQGQLYNANKLLIDPYSYALHGEFQPSVRHRAIDEQGVLCPLDNAHLMPKSKVCQATPYTGKRPDIPWSETVIYECHVKGWSARHNGISPAKRGTFLALAEHTFIEHVKALGVTSVELMPVHEFISEPFLAPLGLSNYWGYNTLSYFAPHRDYALDHPVQEFTEMVSKLHSEGLEVIIDVVYNHSSEGALLGPCCHLRGFDNRAYYRLDGQGQYINDTGCGNTLALEHPQTLQLVLDSLRYWYQVLGVDGFRFDLAPILGRNKRGFDAAHSFFQCLAQDPILRRAKVIAEPWDIGPGGYQLGAFAPPWREWNDQYRDVVRRFWRGDADMLGLLAKRLHGSADIFVNRPPSSSINFIVSHDGFTLTDLVSYEHKHNQANGEHNRDGHSANYSCNYGVEGHSQDPQVKARRLKAQKNLLLTLLLSKGVPMLSAGSELGHTQGGNNNAYCQDNAISWLAWHDYNSHHPLASFISEVLTLRRYFAIFTLDRHVHPDDPRFSLLWYRPDGTQMQTQDWHDASLHTLIYTLVDNERQQSLAIVLHRGGSERTLRLPPLALSSDAPEPGDECVPGRWHCVLSSDSHTLGESDKRTPPDLYEGDELTLSPGSSSVFSNIPWPQIVRPSA
ncbi:glycogen debranching protein GlgX [Pseudoalteromonas sp. T1lg75]|uniref:glycogen debranching protein GlgX n=1 Tax=Pseudoalteromonas sp. T1lg75 TaxID=2077102 RepID=UPI000CF6FFD4|nr:glycogen debranching protein GlgX [Pseudoalteromonas sp. T1lg75]